MKSIFLLFLGSLIAFSGAYGCSESGTGATDAPPVIEQSGNPAQNSNAGSNQANPATGDNPTNTPDDLSGTNLAPPPAPPTP